MTTKPSTKPLVFGPGLKVNPFRPLTKAESYWRRGFLLCTANHGLRFTKSQVHCIAKQFALFAKHAPKSRRAK